MDMSSSMTGMSTMPSSTMNMASMSSMSMPSSTSMSSSMSGMDMSSDATMPMSMMSMTFFTAHTTPLFSTQWTPTTVGQYAGTCIFLIALSLSLRAMYAIKCGLEARWHAQDLKRRYVVTQAPRRQDEDDTGSDSDTVTVAVAAKGSDAVLTVNGVTERVKVVQRSDLSGVPPFRLRVDGTRACFVTVMVGVAYLLMLVVMTMNVGYFLSVLGGAFLGELALGRYSTQHAEHHH